MTTDLRDLGGRWQSAKRSPMKYPGSKYDVLAEILPRLPYRGAYIEIFGGSGVVLFNRKSSKLEVYNDRYGGVCAFYRAVRDSCKELCDRLELTCHSKEEWEWCTRTWNDDQLDDVERAARWYYSLQYSFLGQRRSFARITSPTSGVAGTLNRKLPGFWNIHQRLRNVQIENLDWEKCMDDYDHPDAVFYLDPPYLNADTSSYDLTMSKADHKRMLDKIMDMQGYVMLSGYPNDLYDGYDWTEVISFPRRDRANSQAVGGNNRSGPGERRILTEVLWIKEAN